MAPSQASPSPQTATPSRLPACPGSFSKHLVIGTPSAVPAAPLRVDCPRISHTTALTQALWVRPLATVEPMARRSDTRNESLDCRSWQVPGQR